MSRVVDGDVATLRARLAQPITLPSGDDWVTSLFPMPYAIDAGSLAEGDVHTLYFRYHRWLVTNTHRGWIRLRIDEISPHRITTTFIEDTSYLSKYMTIHGTRVDFEPLADGRTRVHLTQRYSRELDPAWYFGPLQRYAVGVALDRVVEVLFDGDEVESEHAHVRLDAPSPGARHG